jgi:DNA mismatch endonuclease (patch repair protein)
MKRVRQRGTDAELTVRRMLTGAGARYRVNAKSLPGSPDIVNRSTRKAIFMHGCFWHHHEVCGRGKVPASNRDFWADKLRRNVERDVKKVAALRALGFDVLTVWECELETPQLLASRLKRFWTRRVPVRT